MVLHHRNTAAVNRTPRPDVRTRILHRLCEWSFGVRRGVGYHAAYRLKWPIDLLQLHKNARGTRHSHPALF